MQNISRILSDLIAFDTTSRNSNLELIGYIQVMLNDLGIKSELTWDSGKGKANLFATIGASDQPGIVLSGHTDVVPVDGQDWHSEPFEATLKDDRLYGRGSCDMKGFIAVCLANAGKLLDADLPVPFHFAFSYDEEVGCVGVRGLIEALRQREVMPSVCIIGEPTSMQVIRAHKGMFYQKCCVHGKSAHSSQVNRGVNAVSIAARLINKIDSIGQRIQQQGPFDEGFEPPYTTLHAGVIKGGTVNNIIPNECRFEYEIRNIPEQSVLPVFNEIKQYADQELLPLMQRVSAESGIDWQTLAEFPPLSTDEGSALNQMVQQLAQQTEPSGKVSYGTEGGLFDQAGIATVVCGPGSIDQAHKPDEYVSLDQLQQCSHFIDRLIQYYSQ